MNAGRTFSLSDVQSYISTQIQYVSIWYNHTDETVSILNQLLCLEEASKVQSEYLSYVTNGEYEEFVENSRSDPHMSKKEYFLCSYYLDEVEQIMKGDIYFEEDTFEELARTMMR